MSIPDTLVRALLIGIAATLGMDLWNLFLKHAFGIPSLNYCLLGRWLGHMPSGVYRHASIAAAAPRTGECRIGWVAHYSIGIAMATGFILLVSPRWLAEPTMLPAVLYGLATVIFPFMVMQPALGLGIASARTPHPVRARLKSLATHTVFGVGLYLAAVALG